MAQKGSSMANDEEGEERVWMGKSGGIKEVKA